jgi:hypothetical protein
MARLKMLNAMEVEFWLHERRRMGRDTFSIKGQPPIGATYSDGDPIINPINIAWVDSETGERINCVYAKGDRNARQ